MSKSRAQEIEATKLAPGLPCCKRCWQATEGAGQQTLPAVSPDASNRLGTPLSAWRTRPFPAAAAAVIVPSVAGRDMSVSTDLTPKGDHHDPPFYRRRFARSARRHRPGPRPELRLRLRLQLLRLQLLPAVVWLQLLPAVLRLQLLRLQLIRPPLQLQLRVPLLISPIGVLRCDQRNLF